MTPAHIDDQGAAHQYEPVDPFDYTYPDSFRTRFTYPEDDREYPRGGLIGCACLTLAAGVLIAGVWWFA